MAPFQGMRYCCDVDSTSPANNDSGSRRLSDAFLAEERQGLLRGLQLRLIAMPIIAIWVTIENPYPAMLFFESAVGVFLILGGIPYWLDRRGQYLQWHRYLFPALDVLVLAVVNFVPNPFAERALSPQIMLRFSNEMYVFLIISSAAFTYNPRIVLWTGVVASLTWALFTGIVFSLPESLGSIPSEAAQKMTLEELEAALSDPRRIYTGILGRQIILFPLTALAIAAFVHRARQLVGHHASAERARSNLSRYFSANMVEELADLDEPLGATRQQEVAVLFVDLLNFTTLSEKLAATALIDLLRGFHSMMEQCIFASEGTLDKFLGDGLMATFGTPHTSAQDATNALRCVQRMKQALADWNANPANTALKISIGVHHGSVILGDIGGDQRLEFAVLGDTVNVASRIEELTRELSVADLVSQETLEAARNEGAAAAIIDPYRLRDERILRGRSTPTRLWTSDTV